MDVKSILTFLLLAFMNSIFCQELSLNQRDAQGNRNGKWFVYLNKDWKTINDSANAVFYRYTYFDHGTNIYPMGECGGKNHKLEGDTKSKVLNGEYKWYDGNGKVSSVHVFQNGEYVSCKEYFPSGELHQYFDFTKKCEGQPHGWTVFVYDKKGNLRVTAPTCKDKNGKWPKMRG